jgi:hypothetical protein
MASLLPPGTSYPFTVTVTAEDDASLSETDVEVFTMPAVAFNYLEADPPVVYASPGAPATFDLHLTNVGNAAGTFEVTTTPPITAWTSSAPYAVTLDAGVRDVSTISFTPVGASLGDRQVLRVSSPAPSSAYTQTEYVAVQIAGSCVAPAYRIARIVDHLDDVDLENALYTLSDRLSRWELDEGNEALQESTVAALCVVIDRLRPYTIIDTADLEALADAPSVASFCAPLGDLEDQIDRVALRYVVADLDPGYDATLPGQPITYTLRLQSRGTLTTTYRTALELKKAASQQVVNGQIASPAATFDTTLTPKQAIEIPVVIVPEDLGWMQLGAHTEAIEDDFIQAQAKASLKVVGAYMRVLSLDADPPFVETGVSSTALSVQVANVANVYRDVDAQTHAYASDGSLVWTGSTALDLQPDAPRSYGLGDVKTSGWEASVHTVTVDLLDAHGVLVPGGSGHGYLAVGQGLHVDDHSVDPGLVAPGTVTVTTRITTEVDVSLEPDAGSMDGESSVLDFEPGAEEHDSHDAGIPYRVDRPSGLAASLRQSGSGVVRIEEDDPSMVYTGTWSTWSFGYASAGQCMRSRAISDTVSLTFDGTWVSVGVRTGTNGGQAEVFIDGASQGIIDAYSREDDVATYIYDGLSTDPHTISIVVLGTKTPFSSNTYLYLDYIDVWDGTLMSAGTFEQDDTRVYTSTNWSVEPEAIASGGTYIRGGSNAWFHFTGDSVSFQGLADTNTDNRILVKILIDGVSRGTFDFYHATLVTRTYSFDDLGPDLHVIQIQPHRGKASVDAFTTPGVPPFYQAPAPTGIVRYEEDDPTLRYNGVPFHRTATSWHIESHGLPSGGYRACSKTMSDTVSLTFYGTWASIGLLTADNAGLAEVFIDGQSRDVVDTYSDSEGMLTLYYPNLITGTHTISVTVLDQRNPESREDWVNLDYIDVWDGTTMPGGRFEATLSPNTRVYRSNGWEEDNGATAGDGTFLKDGHIWFPFTGDSVIYIAMTRESGARAEVFIDGVSRGEIDAIYAFSTSPVAFEYSDLASFRVETTAQRSPLPPRDSFTWSTPTTARSSGLPLPAVASPVLSLSPIPMVMVR